MADLVDLLKPEFVPFVEIVSSILAPMQGLLNALVYTVTIYHKKIHCCRKVDNSGSLPLERVPSTRSTDILV